MKPPGFHTAPAKSRNAPLFFKRLLRLAFALIFTVVLQLRGQTTSVAIPTNITGRTPRILVRPKSGQTLTNLHSAYGVRRLSKFKAIGGIEVLEVPHGMTAAQLIGLYQKSGLVEYAEPDHIVHAALTPNDPYFVNGTQWHLHNNGASGGIVGADIDATNAWDTITSAASIIVAVIDSGVRYTHQDLAPNMWHNPSPGGDGYTDDIYGINAITGSGDPNDDYGHGTHVAGLVGAKGSNGIGVCGVCWTVQIMALKFVDSQGNGSISDAITCIDYATTKGAKVMNFSWGDTTFTSQALYDAISAARDAGIIFVAACGNEGTNTDVTPYYPSSYTLDNIISVAATTRADQLASYSSYGPATVDLGAPGDTIFSCWNSSDSSYQYLSGTSMAAPIVAGACALLWSEYPSESYSDIINRIVNNTDPLPMLAGKCVSGGRLNLAKAMNAPPPTPPPTVTVTASDPIAVISTSDTGAFTFTRTGDTSSALTVNYQLGGSAVKWDDYRRPQGDMPTSVTIPSGTNALTMIIDAIGNETGANPETVVLSLSSNADYAIGSPSGGTITIYPSTPLFIQNLHFTPPSGVTVTWASVPGEKYQVRYATNFSRTTWQNASGVITAGSTNTTWSGTVSGGQAYYLVVEVN